MPSASAVHTHGMRRLKRRLPTWDTTLHSPGWARVIRMALFVLVDLHQHAHQAHGYTLAELFYILLPLFAP
jgi:hypothetical protein